MRIILLFWLLVGSIARADIEEFLYFFPDADTRLGAISSEYTAFDEAFDVLDYLDKIETSSRPQSADSLDFGLTLKPTEKLKIFFEKETSRGTVKRLTEPFSVESEVEGYTLGVNLEWLNLGEQPLIWSLTHSKRKQDPLIVDCYEYAGIVLGGSCDSANFRFLDSELYSQTGERAYLPVLNSRADQDSWSFSVTSNLPWSVFGFQTKARLRDRRRLSTCRSCH